MAVSEVSGKNCLLLVLSKLLALQLLCSSQDWVFIHWSVKVYFYGQLKIMWTCILIMWRWQVNNSSIATSLHPPSLQDAELHRDWEDIVVL